MPSVNLQITLFGPQITVTIGVSAPRRAAMDTAKIAIPPPVQCNLLIDTGASGTCLDSWVIHALGLMPSGSVDIHTPSTQAGNAHACNQYDVQLTIPHPSLSYSFHAIPVIESSFSHQGIDGLLGRDVLASCLFIYNGELGVHTLSF